MADIPGNQQNISGLSPGHGHGVETSVFRIADFGIFLVCCKNIQTNGSHSSQNDIHRFRRKMKLLSAQHVLIFSKDFFVQQGNGFSKGNGKQNCARIGVDVQQCGNQHIGIDHSVKHYRPALAAEISALISARDIFELPFACDRSESFRMAAIASSAAGTGFIFTEKGTPCSNTSLARLIRR